MSNSSDRPPQLLSIVISQVGQRSQSNFGGVLNVLLLAAMRSLLSRPVDDHW